MKFINTNRNLSGLLLGMLLACNPLFASNGEAGGKDKNSDQVSVSWTDPAKFTESRYGPQINQAKPEIWLGDMQKTLVKRGGSVLKPGEHLDVVITDVKLAGQVEPSQGGRNDVRVIKSIYPPDISLSFTLTGADGKVLNSGERKLSDVAFLDRDRGTRGLNDAYRFEKRLLEDWVRTEFGKDSKQ